MRRISSPARFDHLTSSFGKDSNDMECQHSSFQQSMLLCAYHVRTIITVHGRMSLSSSPLLVRHTE
ncbi:MAG: hypothetical protein IMW89_01640 [Ktedonobacteraceae bacterium]|nr:hypothetical protein [Ktedonobacteraceae bacterium]